ncbi:hypothetical protein ACFQ44_09510 [Levilactobacillus lanxiensis]|jgi:hypothetical protein|uniref:YtxH domain-containing protein n=1 Tax=Levilactobacillus lanxiensis TaxID=2799568 RepID=A0ABW4D5P8_9LACO|nr:MULTISPECIES: hypothetical protein [Levilactobacillus]
MGLGRFLTGTTLAVGVGLAAYLTLTKQDPLTWGKNVKQQAQHTAAQIDDIRQAKDRVAQRATGLTAALTAAQPVLDDIQTDVDKFAFKIAPRVSAIQEILDEHAGE